MSREAKSQRAVMSREAKSPMEIMRTGKVRVLAERNLATPGEGEASRSTCLQDTFVAFHPDVEVRGCSMYAFIDGMGGFRPLAIEVLAECGIHDLQPDGWYDQQRCLDSFGAIAQRLGPATLFSIGRKVPDNALFPTEAHDIFQALKSMDMAYHTNHRLHGEVLLDALTGGLCDVIGHYHYRRTGESEVTMCCDDPYPCRFDQGIIDAMACRFRPPTGRFEVLHDDGADCRAKGGRSCTYVVRW